MVFAALMTQLMARTTTFLDSRHKVPMTKEVYMYDKWILCMIAWCTTDIRATRRAIVPIGVMFSMSLIFGNIAYMYLSVSFIQMLKVS